MLELILNRGRYSAVVKAVVPLLIIHCLLLLPLFVGFL